jgi:cytochrome c oxidase cbb3-type subunit III
MIRLLLLAFCLTLGGCERAVQLIYPAGNLELGRTVYNYRCYFCHGYSGNAKTLAATFLDPRPADFTAPVMEKRSRDDLRAVVRNGRPGTAMHGFDSMLSLREINAVVDFVSDEFVRKKARNTHYHTPENGWNNHEKYRLAFPFATGEVALDTPWENLTTDQVTGKRLFLGACITCHDRGRVNDAGAAWELTAVSYPPNVDACTGCHTYSKLLHAQNTGSDTRQDKSSHGIFNSANASSALPFSLHDRAPHSALNAIESRGAQIFRKNCTFCHAADGSGQNWVGAFIEPHPRNLADPRYISSASRQQLADAIRNGIKDTSMPAWKSVLREDEIKAVVAYLTVAFGQPREPR